MYNSAAHFSAHYDTDNNRKNLRQEGNSHAVLAYFYKTLVMHVFTNKLPIRFQILFGVQSLISPRERLKDLSERRCVREQRDTVARAKYWPRPAVLGKLV